ncbi:helix-turn-helix domain-containing protein [Roseibium sp. MMSF_3544]|uniref:helix-turn-helix domain-containing protein n=1 Tax=unclassified Roseibium TaxID=2629323 RepID=UPI00273FCE76|nr:cupin domain-containing protein [Roseibium sp. MMSF_3544]
MAEADKVVSFAENLLSLGSEVRQLRKARQMTLKDLTKASGISLSHLSAIERGASNPSMDVLERLSVALSVSPDWFFARRPGAGPMERAYVVRSQNRRNLNSLYGQNASELGYTDSLLSSSVGGEFYMGLAVYEPNSETPDNRLQRHDGEQHGLVIEGELEIQIADEIITLREGDSYSFDARIPHHARNRTDRICKLIWAVSPVVIPKDLAEADGLSQRVGPSVQD